MQAAQAHGAPIDEVIAHDQTDPDRGLTTAQASEGLRQYGPNELTEKPRPDFLALLWEQFNNYLVIILVVAALLALALGEYIDAIAILCIVAPNAVIGVVQESKAEQALAALKKLAAPSALILMKYVVRATLRKRPAGTH